MYYDENGLVICQECKKSYNLITLNHLKKSHSMTMGEYKEKYPNVPLSRKDYYKITRNKSKNDQNISNPPKPIIEELSSKINDDELFNDDQSLEELSKSKIPSNINYESNKRDPVQDKIDILNYLKSNRFPHMKSNYLFKKMQPRGTVECEFYNDMADPKNKVVFDFPNAFWHNNDNVPQYTRYNILKSHGWYVFEITNDMPKIKHIQKRLKKVKFNND